MSSLILAVSPFVINAVMEGVKVLGVQDWSTAGKRTMLAVVAILGVAAGNYLNGTPVDVASLQNLTQIALESLAAFLAAHGSYHLFWSK